MGLTSGQQQRRDEFVTSINAGISSDFIAYSFVFVWNSEDWADLSPDVTRQIKVWVEQYLRNVESLGKTVLPTKKVVESSRQILKDIKRALTDNNIITYSIPY